MSLKSFLLGSLFGAFIITALNLVHDEPIVTACAITVKGSDGNKHTFIGSGEVWK